MDLLVEDEYLREFHTGLPGIQSSSHDHKECSEFLNLHKKKKNKTNKKHKPFVIVFGVSRISKASSLVKLPGSPGSPPNNTRLFTETK
jgi:hypothetical protein